MKKVIYTILVLLLVFMAIGSYIIRLDNINDDDISTMAKINNTISTIKTGNDLKNYFEANGTERTFLVLFQNDMEIRPGGGFIGTFGIVTIKDGEIVESEAYDSWLLTYNNAEKVPAPIQMKEWLGVTTMEFLDSNWSPDFPTNAQSALTHYENFSTANPQYEKDFDGVLAVNTQILPALLDATGPVNVEGYPVTFTSDDVANQLEQWVEIDYKAHGIDTADRKSIMKDLTEQVINEVQSLDTNDQLRVLRNVENLLDSKDMMVYSLDSEMQTKIANQGWAGEIDTTHTNDYLMVVDANIGGLKADPYIDRKVNYSVNFEGERPVATLKMTYAYNASNVDWRTPETFQMYSRAYVPDGSHLISFNGESADPLYFEKDLGKQIYGIRVQIHMNTTQEFIIQYELPETITRENYNLLIENQSGVERENTTSII